jgi:hypothetical protein
MFVPNQHDCSSPVSVGHITDGVKRKRNRDEMLVDVHEEKDGIKHKKI